MFIDISKSTIPLPQLLSSSGIDRRRFTRNLAIMLAFSIGLHHKTSKAGSLIETRDAPSDDVMPVEFIVGAVSPSGGIAYLVPTIHIVARSSPTLPLAVATCIKGAKSVSIEADPKNKEDLQRSVELARYKVGDQLSNHLSPLTLDLLHARANREGFRFEDIQHFKPWAVSFLLQDLEKKHANLAQAPSAETLIIEQANQMSVPLKTIETMQLQLKLYDRFPDHTQDLMLQGYLLQNSQPNDTKQALIGIANAWYEGDLALLLERLDALDTVPLAIRPEVDSKLLSNRNSKFADHVKTALTSVGKGEHIVVALGAEHFKGRTGLPQLLAQRGLTLQSTIKKGSV